MLEWLEAQSPLGAFAVVAIYLLARWVLVCGFFFAVRAAMAGRRRISSHGLRPGQLRDELHANLKSLVFDWIVLCGIVGSGIPAARSFSWLALSLSFLAMYVYFEAWFYVTHRLLHERRFRVHHAWHHRSVAPTPLSAQSFSFVEKLINEVGILLLPCLATQVTPLLFEGVIAYHLYNFVVNVLGHSDVEILPSWFVRSPFGKLLASPTYHTLHHSRGSKNFGLFTTVLDRALGTYDAGYEAAFERAVTPRAPRGDEPRAEPARCS